MNATAVKTEPSPELMLEGRLQVDNTMCDCRHPANFHAGFTGGCTGENEGRKCICLFHSALDPFRWDRAMRDERAAQRLAMQIAEVLSPDDAGDFWRILESGKSWNSQLSDVSADVKAAFELYTEGLEELYERLHF